MSISGFAITSTNVKPSGLVSASGSVLRSVAQCLSASVYSRALASVSISALNYISASVSSLRHCYNVSQCLDKCNAETSLCVLPSVCSNEDQGTDLDEV